MTLFKIWPAKFKENTTQYKRWPSPIQHYVAKNNTYYFAKEAQFFMRLSLHSILILDLLARYLVQANVFSCFYIFQKSRYLNGTHF